ncbi:MAG: response regulator [Elusimicrobiales bacterium]|nr:response regulator [Elusimicrobiales bacterium]
MADETRIKVVAVDDDETILEIYETGLAAAGMEVRSFCDPKKAREFFAEAKPGAVPDVILMDIMMPGVDGISLMGDIRSKEAAAHIPIIAVSGLNDAATLNDALLFGAMDYLVKPFDLDTLTEKIKKAAELSRKRAQKP